MGFIGRAVAPAPISANDVPDLPASKITSGTIASAQISEASVTQHAQSVDLQPVKSDITALALREATNESSASFNLPNQHIDTFATDTLGTKTTAVVDSGFVVSKSLGTLTEYDYNGASTKAQIQFQNFVDPSGNTYYEIDNDGDSGHSNTKFVIPSIALAQNGYGGYSDQLGDSTYFQIDYGSTQTFKTRLKIGKNGTYGDIYSFKISYSTDGSNYSFLDCSNVSEYAIERGSGSTTGGNFNSGTGTSGGIVTFIDCGARSVTHVSTLQGIPEFSARYIKVSPQVRHGGYSNNNAGMGIFAPYQQPLTTSATGTIIQNTNTVGSAKTKVGGTMLYKNNQGTATLGTDLKVYFSCNGGTNWTEASSYSAITPVYSTGISQVRLGETTCTSGTDVRYKVEWANQSSGSKETELHGIGTNY
jgi:hypothetical protein